MSRTVELRLLGERIDLGRPWLMGIVNATPDSFSDAGEHTTASARVRRAQELVADGASVIDIGGQSGITGVPEIEVAEEIMRVMPVVQGVTATTRVRVSVDTYKPAVASAVIDAGAAVINDVSGLLYPEVAEICASSGAGLVLMHNRSKPKERLTDPLLYLDVVDDVVQFIEEKMEQAVQLGVPESSIIIDPGPDFSKTPYQTIKALQGIAGSSKSGARCCWRCPERTSSEHSPTEPRASDWPAPSQPSGRCWSIRG